MTKPIKNKWIKCPSVTRQGKFFYYEKEHNRSIIQSWVNDFWYLSENGKCSQDMFKTPKQAMKWAETNVLH